MEIKKIGLITAGGDAPGMNPCLRFLIKGLIDENYEVFGIYRGFKGIIEKNYQKLTKKDAGGIIEKGGTILGTSRYPDFINKEVQKKAVKNLEEMGIDAIVVIGGDGSMHGAYALSQMGVNVIGIPASIDNDIYGTDETLGADTSLNTIVKSIDIIKDTASSHDRAFIIEVMGHTSGFLALNASITTGAEACFIPEYETDVDEVVRRLNQRYVEGKSNSIIVVAEGYASGYKVKEILEKKGCKYELRVTVLGHLQRGGSPTFKDRKLALEFATHCIQLIKEKTFGIMTISKNGKISHIPLKEVVSHKKTLDENLLKMMDTIKWED
ncbi:MAG: ATP-dependent 6-phosphofructokinase [candidate division WOR-3 bacterium]